LNPAAPVSGLLPGLQLPSLEGRAITVADLVTHSAGLPQFLPNLVPPDWRNPYRDYAVPHMIDGLAQTRLARKPGEKYEYSNVHYALLGLLLAQREGKPYARLLAERLFRPLQLTGCAVGPTSTPERLARGRDADGQPQPAWDFQAFEAAGAVRAPVRDVMKWAAANMDPAGDETGLALAFSQTPLRAAGDGQIAYGWHVSPSGVTWHNGQTGGHHAFVGFRRDRKVGVVILSGSATMILDDLGFAIIGELTGAPQPPRPLRLAQPVDPADAQVYVGRYRIGPQQDLVVRLTGARLTLQVPPQEPVGLYREAADRFFFRVLDAGVTFHRGASGRVEALTLHQNGDRRAPRVE
jgi:CubicO group peptidase (beta-lactamase class C family)